VLLIGLCNVYLAEGDLKELRQAARHGLETGREHNLARSVSFHRFFLGVDCYLRNDLAEAEKHLVTILNPVNKTSVLNFSRGAFILALTCQAQGRQKEAGELAEQVINLALEKGNPQLLKTARAFQAEISFRQGDIAKATRWADNNEPDLFCFYTLFYMPHLTKAKILLAQGTTESLQQADALLFDLYDFLVSIHSIHYLIDVLMLQTLVHHARAEEPDAFTKLNRAIDLAEPGGYVRPFLDLGPKMGNLLNRMAKQNADVRYVAQLLAAFRKEATANVQIPLDFQTAEAAPGADIYLDETLSKREIEIIGLLSERMGNKEIAEKLFLSPKTVKSHLYNIFQKLNVTTRRQAAEKANALGILAKKKDSTN
jgi:LuxR family maltose regulon positive regulatory protein